MSSFEPASKSQPAEQCFPECAQSDKEIIEIFSDFLNVPTPWQAMSFPGGKLSISTVTAAVGLQRGCGKSLRMVARCRFSLPLFRRNDS